MFTCRVLLTVCVQFMFEVVRLSFIFYLVFNIRCVATFE